MSCVGPVSLLRDEIIGDGFDFVVMRELTGGLYLRAGTGGKGTAFGLPRYPLFTPKRESAHCYQSALRLPGSAGNASPALIKPTYWIPPPLARSGSRGCQRLLDVECVDMLVDNAAMQLVKDPKAI